MTDRLFISLAAVFGALLIARALVALIPEGMWAFLALLMLGTATTAVALTKC